MRPLERLIRERIARTGPMPLADYMALCLHHPEHGYYTTRDPLGAGGDFITAPEISQLFGEMIGGWIAQVWLEAGGPASVLVELGPGRGTLMADALRVARRVRGFSAAVELWLVETSPALRRAQAHRLAGHGPRWAARLEEVPDRPLLLVANEFFDALPVTQLLRLDQGWQERVVVLDVAGLAWGWSPVRMRPALEHRYGHLPEGAILEISAAGEAVAAEIGRRLTRAGGAALIIDYGAWEGTGDTLQAVARHRRADPLHAPGQADLTAHVRFAPLAAAAGVAAWGPLPQGVFLERLGITERARQLAAGRTEPEVASIAQGHRRLTHPAAMGQLFKAMALTPRGRPAPPGFAPWRSSS